MADRSPHGPNVFVCSYQDCKKFFRKRSRLMTHYRSHTGERPYVCSYDDCVKSYTRAAHLKRHFEFAHGNPADRVRLTYKCPFEGCGLMVINQWNLTKHIRRRHQSQQFVCQVGDCGKRCKSTKQLKRHEREHHSVNPFRCSFDDCGKVFSCESRLKRHQKVHEGYRCQYEGCAETLSNWSLLRKHVAVAHKIPAELMCHVCSRKFVSKANLRMHMVIHSESRPVFECPREKCGRIYLDKRNLCAHIRSYHDGKRFACDHVGCTRTFSSKKKMLLHSPLHDPNRPLPKRKRKKRVISVSDCPVNVKQKKRCKQHVAASLCGLTSPVKHGAGDGVGGVEIDEDDRVVLSGSEAEAGCNLVIGWKQFLPISNADTYKKICPNQIHAVEPKNPSVRAEDVLQSCQKINRINCISNSHRKSATVVFGEADADQAQNTPVIMPFSSESGEKSEQSKGLILKPAKGCREEDESLQTCSDTNHLSSPSVNSSGPVVAWDIIAFSRTGRQQRGSESEHILQKQQTKIDVKRCVVLDDLSEKCTFNSHLCNAAAQDTLN